MADPVARGSLPAPGPHGGNPGAPGDSSWTNGHGWGGPIPRPSGTIAAPRGREPLGVAICAGRDGATSAGTGGDRHESGHRGRRRGFPRDLRRIGDPWSGALRPSCMRPLADSPAGFGQGIRAGPGPAGQASPGADGGSRSGSRGAAGGDHRRGAQPGSGAPKDGARASRSAGGGTPASRLRGRARLALATGGRADGGPKRGAIAPSVGGGVVPLTATRDRPRLDPAKGCRRSPEGAASSGRRGRSQGADQDALPSSVPHPSRVPPPHGGASGAGNDPIAPLIPRVDGKEVTRCFSTTSGSRTGFGSGRSGFRRGLLGSGAPWRRRRDRPPPSTPWSSC